MYKGVRYRTREISELTKDFEWAANQAPGTRRIFLADGDVMHLPFETLAEILRRLNNLFPALARVSLYANGSSIMSKSPEQLGALRSLKLSTLYVGLESGDETLLRLVKKGETAAGMVEAVKTAQSIGMRCSVMILLGLGGRKRSRHHIEGTADAVSVMSPKLLSALRFVHFKEIPMFDGFEPLTEHEAVSELREFIRRVELDQTVFRANHSSNPIPMEGRFPRDKRRMIEELDQLLEYGDLDRSGPGRTPFLL